MSRLLVLGTADWNQSIATNQHVMVRELAVDNDIIYTESMGLRQPELRLRDVQRIARRLRPQRENNEGARAVPSRVEVRTPHVVPRHVGLAARLNRPIVARLVRDWVGQKGAKTLWTYTPVTYGLEKVADRTIYHCVDLLGAVPGIDATLIEANERRLAASGAQAIGSSEAVVAHLRDMGFMDVLHWPNVADTAVFENARPSVVERAEDRAVFAGNLSLTKVDFALLDALLDAGVDLHLAGPIAEGGGSAATEVHALIKKGATYHGMLKLPDLATLYWTARVGLIPYAINSYTRGVNPLKTFEYLSAGLGVVATPVPAVSPIDGHVEVHSSASTFVAAVQRQFAISADHERAEIARTHSWSERGAAARMLIASQGEFGALRGGTAQ